MKYAIGAAMAAVIVLLSLVLAAIVYFGSGEGERMRQGVIREDNARLDREFAAKRPRETKP